MDPVLTTRGFYDDLAADYHLLFRDWRAAIAAQGEALDRLLGGRPLTVLDCACGIGTQAIGLAERGHVVVGSDLSPVAARRAAVEGGLPVVAADMRRLPFRAGIFDAVVCADNAVSHLLHRDGLRAALGEMRRVLRRGGTMLIGVRSDAVLATRPEVGTPQVHRAREGPVITLQLWDWHPDGEHYDLRHVQLKPDGDGYTARVRRETSWVIPHADLASAASDAGFVEPVWHRPEDTGFGHHLLIARA